MPSRTFSPATESTCTSTPSPIMMLWPGFRVSTSIACLLRVVPTPQAAISPTQK